MPNQKDRKKKAGGNKGKKTERMRKALEERKARAAPPKKSRTASKYYSTIDKPQELKRFVPGGADDKYTKGSRARGARGGAR